MVTINELAPNNSNNEVKALLKKSYEDIWRDTLSHLEIIFRNDEKAYNLIRSKVLRIGNDKVRDLDSIFDNYVTFKVNDYQLQKSETIEKQIFDFSKQWKLITKGEANGKRSDVK